MSQLTLSVAGFYVSRTGIVVSSTQLVTRDGAQVPELFSNTGVGATAGLEVFVQQRLWRGLEGWLSYTLAQSTVSPSSTATASLSQYDQTHVLGLALSYQLPWDAAVSVRYQYARGNPTTAVTGSVFDSSTNEYLPTTSTTLGARLPDFHQLDVRVEKTWTVARTRLTAFLDVRNVTNQANVVEPLTYSYDYQQQAGRTALPIYPVVGVRGDY